MPLPNGSVIPLGLSDKWILCPHTYNTRIGELNFMSTSPYDSIVARYLGQRRKRPRWADVLFAPNPETLSMSKPLMLCDAVVNRLQAEFAGNYAYGRLNKEGVFEVLYVGRFDPNCSDRMKH